MDNDPQPRWIFWPTLADDILKATNAMHPEARIPETPMPKWTPGPWYANADRQPYHRCLVHAHGERIASTFCDRDGPNEAANARLIAAAPELHSALVTAEGALRKLRQNAMKRDGNQAWDDGEIATEALDIVAAALAKALGDGGSEI